MRRKKDRSNGITALYERLSRDDDNAGESNSIVHQKQMLEDYAMKHGLRILFILPMMVGVERPLTDLHGTDLLKVLKTEKSLPVSAKICPESAETICK